MMLAYRLVRMIETHSDALAQGLLARVQACDRTPDYLSKVPAAELEQRVYEVYRNLGDWLLGKTESDIQSRYSEIGARRAAQHVPFCQLMWAIVLTKEHLWEFMKKEAVLERPVEIFGELEILQLLDQFFDRAIFYAAEGYARAAAAPALATQSG